MLNPIQYRHIFGKTWIDHQATPVLQLGKRSFNRYEMVSKLGCGNLVAAKNLMGILGELQVSSLKDLKALDPAALASIKGVGPTTLFVAMCLLEAEGVDVDAWYTGTVTFNALKERAKKHGLHDTGALDGAPDASGEVGGSTAHPRRSRRKARR
jgi:hypothetical protein